MISDNDESDVRLEAERIRQDLGLGDGETSTRRSGTARLRKMFELWTAEQGEYQQHSTLQHMYVETAVTLMPYPRTHSAYIRSAVKPSQES